MSKVLKYAAAVAVGLLVWVFVATLGNFVLRAAIPDYRAQEMAVTFSLIAQLGRLALGVVSTAVAAAAAAAMSRGSNGAALAVGCVLLVMFVPVHVSLWQKFPVWYHLFFLASLPLVAYVVGRLVGSRRGATSSPHRAQ
jgi:hypothetical protein